MLPTYRRRPSLIACETWAPGRLNAAREVLRFGLGLRAGLASAEGAAGLPLVRQLGEAKARPSVRTFWKGGLVGAGSISLFREIRYDLTHSGAPPSWASLDRPSCIC